MPDFLHSHDPLLLNHVTVVSTVWQASTMTIMTLLRLLIVKKLKTMNNTQNITWAYHCTWCPV